MIDQMINEQLVLLQKELEKLKTATQYIENAKGNSDRIIVELETVQQNYGIYTDRIFNLYKQYIDDLKKNVEIQINDGVFKFETTGSKIDITNKEKLVETKRLLEQYKKIVDATDNLVKTLDAVDFPTKLDVLHSKSQFIIDSITNVKLDIGIELNNIHNLIIDQTTIVQQQIIQNNSIECNAIINKMNNYFIKQEKKIEKLKMLLLVMFFSIIFGILLNVLMKLY